ncbi:MAG TPA: tetratricopeptide repeat protein [Tepidisphaeraceae bacterium]|nr:tetratricopeptide repeat protein [Tepidisphaeraceae bacterium]
MQWMRHIGLPLAGMVIGSTALVIAQDRPPEVQVIVQEGGIDLQSIFGRDNTSSVYVRDSAVAVEKIALAERMERLQEWNKAAELYQEILEQYADRVLPSQTDDENKIYQYASVAKAVQDRLSRWPAAGLGVYRARYEPLAQAMLDGAAFDDLPVLHGILQQYFPTTTALTAGMRLVDLYLESGDFGGAVWIAQRLVSMHPDVGPRRAALLFRLGAAQHLAGDVAGATATLKRLRDDHADATLAVGDQSISID